jgi:hypothetical protein
MVPFLDPVDREVAVNPSRNRQGVFASLDDIHYPRNVRKTGEVEAPRRPRIDASDHRKGSGEDWVAFLEKAGVSEAVLFPSEGLSVGFFQQTDYAVRVCRAFNDYVSERYRKVDKRLSSAAPLASTVVRASGLAQTRLPIHGPPGFCAIPCRWRWNSCHWFITAYSTATKICASASSKGAVPGSCF